MASEVRTFEKVDAWWRAANYLSVGQIYLLDNLLLHEPLSLAHIKRLLGHWGTTLGLSFIYAHMNRVFANRHLSSIGVGDDAWSAMPRTGDEAYLEGTYGEVYPHVGRNAEGMRRLFSSSPFREESRVTWRPRRQAPFMKAANSAIRCCMPMAPSSTAPASWRAA